MTYDELRQIVAKYQDLCKCPELKVSNLKTIKIYTQTSQKTKLPFSYRKIPFAREFAKFSQRMILAI